MKVLLTILCGIVILFCGGCALVLMGSASGISETVGLLPLLAMVVGIALLNLFTVLSIGGAITPARFPMQALASLELLLAGLNTVFWRSVDNQNYSFTLEVLVTTVLVVKGFGTFYYARKL